MSDDLDEAAGNLTLPQNSDGCFESIARRPAFFYALGDDWEVRVVSRALQSIPGIEVAT